MFSWYLAIVHLVHAYKPILLALIFPQQYVAITIVNPQASTPYFTVQVPVYNGDTHLKVVDRLRRTSSIPGNLKVELLRYETDARSIPVVGEKGPVKAVDREALFSVSQDGSILLTEPQNGVEALPLGTHMQYTVDMS